MLALGDRILFAADLGECRIREVSGGTISTVAGNGTCGYIGDGGPATSASLQLPWGIVVDASGSLYITDWVTGRIRKVSGGTISTIAGDGTCGFSGDGGVATAAGLNHPVGVAVDDAGTVYIADTSNCRVRAVSGGVISTIAGNGTCGFAGDAGPATAASLDEPQAIATEASGNVYIADLANCRVREVSGGAITTIAGDGSMTNGSCGAASGDGGPATGASVTPRAVTVDRGGNLYIADGGSCQVREVTSGTITTIADNGTCGYAGDGGAATNAALNGMQSISVDINHTVYVSDATDCRVRGVSNGTVSTVAGSGCGSSGDGGLATNATIGSAMGVAADSAGNVYIADATACRIREVSGGVISPIAGNGTCASGGDGGPGTSASLDIPEALALSGNGDLYIQEFRGCRIRRLSGGIITTVAGNGTCGFAGDGGAATSAQLSQMRGIALDDAGNLYIADIGSCRIREVRGGTITTIAGNGICDVSGDGGPATSAELLDPHDVAVDRAGNVFIAGSCLIREVSGGIISTVAGSGRCTSDGDGGPAKSAGIAEPWALAVDADGALFFTEGAAYGSPGCRVRKVAGGTISTIAGNRTCAFGGDGGAATSASFADPMAIALDVRGNLNVTDNTRVREVFGVAAIASGRSAAAPASVGGFAEVPNVPARAGRAHLDVVFALAGAVMLLAAGMGGGRTIRRRRSRRR